jgi:ribosomal protein L21E
MKRIGGFRRKSRAKFTKPLRQKGKISLTRYFQEFNSGDRVLLTVEPAVQKGLYAHKFMGKSGIVKRRNGRCYEIMSKEQNKEKGLIVDPVHLKR